LRYCIENPIDLNALLRGGRLSPSTTGEYQGEGFEAEAAAYLNKPSPSPLPC